MFEFRNTIPHLIYIYLLVGGLLWYWKPSIMFTEQGKTKPFGTGSQDKTVFAFPIVMMFIAIILFFAHETYMLRRMQYEY